MSDGEFPLFCVHSEHAGVAVKKFAEQGDFTHILLPRNGYALIQRRYNYSSYVHKTICSSQFTSAIGSASYQEGKYQLAHGTITDIVSGPVECWAPVPGKEYIGCIFGVHSCHTRRHTIYADRTTGTLFQWKGGYVDRTPSVGGLTIFTLLYDGTDKIYRWIPIVAMIRAKINEYGDSVPNL